jgi:mRNA interferase MazF
MNLNPGDICLIDLGEPPNAIKGHEQALTRPCVIIKDFKYLKLFVIIPITSQKPNYSHYTIVNLPQGIGGLQKESFALCHQIRTISLNRIIKNIGKLPEKEFKKIQAVLIDTLGL